MAKIAGKVLRLQEKKSIFRISAISSTGFFFGPVWLGLNSKKRNSERKQKKKTPYPLWPPHSVSLITSSPVPGYFLKKCDDDDDVIECFHVTDGGHVGVLKQRNGGHVGVPN